MCPPKKDDLGSPLYVCGVDIPPAVPSHQVLPGQVTGLLGIVPTMGELQGGPPGKQAAIPAVPGGPSCGVEVEEKL